MSKVTVCPECGEIRKMEQKSCWKCPCVNHPINVKIGMAKLIRELYLTSKEKEDRWKKEGEEYINKNGIEEYNKYIEERSNILFGE